MSCIRIANARHKVIIFCKSRPFNWQFEVIRSQSEPNKPCLFLLKECDCIAHKAHLSSDFQHDNLKFSKLHEEPTLHPHIKLEYRVICLKMLVCAVWIPVQIPMNYVRIWWMESVWKNCVKTQNISRI